MKIKAERPSIEFEYEFEDGATAVFKYSAPTTKQIDRSFEIPDEDRKGRLDHTKEVLIDCISGDMADKSRMIEELMENGNIYEFKVQLDIALGKHRESLQRG